MHFFQSLFLITGAVSAVAGHRSIHAHLHDRQAAGSVLVTGANGYGDNQIHPRLEINDLVAHHPLQFNLLILAMGEWQTQDSNNATSYYGVAGIHGVPRQSWDGVEPCESCDGADGYCTHASILFPAWHRAYLALFEQEFLSVVTSIANRWTGRQRAKYLKAASTMRLPYWDWAAKAEANSNVFPTVLSSPQISVNGPKGRQTIINPFYQYKVPDTSSLVYAPFTTWPETMRYPDANTAEAVSQDQSNVNAFNNIQQNMQSSVYGLLTNCKDYDHFSHDGATGSTSCSNTLEGIHNTIHTTAGGPGASGVSGGHMTYLPLAALDPLFWLHHANVDRIFALWQAVNPDSYGGSQIATHGTWTIAQGSTQDQDSPLTPFRKDANGFWTTNEVRDWANTFKYTYPEFVDSDGSQGEIAQYISQLYGPSASLTASSISRRVASGSAPKSQNRAEVANAEYISAKRALIPTKAVYLSIGWGANATLTGAYPTGTSPSNFSQYTNNAGAQYEYSCNVRTPRFAFDVSYTVYVFDGQPAGNDSAQWLGDENCVGSLGILAGGQMHGDLIVQGAVSLTAHLQGKVKGGELASMNARHINPYLQKNLNWKIVKEGEDIHPDTLTGYKAAVYSGTTSTGKNGLPQWSAWQPQIEATKGKAGGCQSVEEAHSEWPTEKSPSYSAPVPDSAATTVLVTATATSECVTSTVAVPTYPAQSYPAQSTPAESSPVESTPAPPAYPPVESTPAPPAYPPVVSSPAPPAYPPVESSPVQSSPPPPPVYAPAPYPTSSTPVGGSAAPTGGYSSSSSYPSSTLTPYAGAGNRVSTGSLVSFVLLALTSMLFL